MKELIQILNQVQYTEYKGNLGIQIQDICSDSRSVGNNSLFIAVKGVSVDGHNFINDVIKQGATAIICEHFPSTLMDHVTYIKVPNSQIAKAVIAENFYNNPSTKIKIVGVTGTNGKTTVATLLYKLFSSLGYKVGLLSTVENKIADKTIPATHTTPDAIALSSLLHSMVQEQCTYAFMECSSHAIHQQRIAGLQFAGAIFTNITHDHLDYHHTFDEYIKAKKQFFDFVSNQCFCITNKDDKRGLVMLQNTKGKKLTYGLFNDADYKGKIIENSIHGLHMQVNNQEVYFKLIGEFNAYNILAVTAAAHQLGLSLDDTLIALSKITGAEGRFDYIISDTAITGIVDYAHTPDALENVLETVIKLKKKLSKIITVVGCGGNRDALKRPIMAKVAAKYSSQVILTNDNPRFEDPQLIIDQMKAGLTTEEQAKSFSILDRREAIKMAIALANPNDIILLAGKGHEKYQEIKGVKYDFDDKSILIESFKLLNK